MPRLDGIPVKTEESREVSGQIARLALERFGPERTLIEAELSAAIAMFAADVALVRRDAVDSGILERTAYGAAYRLARSGAATCAARPLSADASALEPEPVPSSARPSPSC